MLKSQIVTFLDDTTLDFYRYRNAQKQSASGGGGAKVDGIKEELEEAQLKVEMNRDALAADIYSLIAKESDFAKVSHWLRAKSSYRLVFHFSF